MEQTLVELTQVEFISLFVLASVGGACIALLVGKFLNNFFYIYKPYQNTQHRHTRQSVKALASFVQLVMLLLLALLWVNEFLLVNKFTFLLIQTESGFVTYLLASTLLLLTSIYIATRRA